MFGYFCTLILRENIGNECVIFSGTAGRRVNLFVDLSRVVIEVSRGLDRRSREAR